MGHEIYFYIEQFFIQIIFLTVLTSCGGGTQSPALPSGSQNQLSSFPQSSLAPSSSSSQSSSASSSIIPEFHPIIPIPANLSSAPVGVAPTGANFIYIKTSRNGDSSEHLHTQKDAVLSIGATQKSAIIQLGIITTAQSFFHFQTSDILTFSAGYYAVTNKDHSIYFPRMYVNPCGGGDIGWFAIDQISFDVDGTLNYLDFRFEATCDDLTTFGQVHWTVSDKTSPPGPLPTPANLWQPKANAVPASGNYVYLESDQDDFIGSGKNYLFTQLDSKFVWMPRDPSLSFQPLMISVFGDTRWDGAFVPMPPLIKMEAGLYSGINGNPIKGDFNWRGNGRGCGDSTYRYILKDWYSIDSIKYNDAGDIESVDIRFEQHCPQSTAALHGKIHWNVNDTTKPVGPTVPPLTLWKAPEQSIPIAGNYYYVEVEPVGQQTPYRSALFTQFDSYVSVTTASQSIGDPGAAIVISGHGDDDSEYVVLKAPEFIDQMQVGYYSNLQRHPFHNTVKGGLDAPHCNQIDGWFVIDKISFDTNNQMQLLDARYELVCDYGIIYRGQVHWSIDDKSAPLPPTNPPPTSLWRPTETLIPKTGNFLLLVSDADDYVGKGQTYLYEEATTSISVETFSDNVSLQIGPWHGIFSGSIFTNFQLLPGYYEKVQRKTGGNPIRGGMDWGG